MQKNKRKAKKKKFYYNMHGNGFYTSYNGYRKGDSEEGVLLHREEYVVFSKKTQKIYVDIQDKVHTLLWYYVSA